MNWSDKLPLRPRHSLEGLLSMNHWIELRRDLVRIYALYRFHPLAVADETVRAFGRCFFPTDENSHAKVASLLLLTAFLTVSYYGQITRGWNPQNPVVLVALFAWVFLLGQLFEIEFEVAVPGVELSNSEDDEEE